MRSTRQRSAVLDALRASSEPLSAQDLHAELGRTVGLATVYRTLQGLVDSGKVDVFRRDTGEALFRLCNPVHHHHLVCERCDRVEEIDACEIEPWATQVAQRRGFQIRGHQADIFGLCAECQAAERNTGGGARGDANVTPAAARG